MALSPTSSRPGASSGAITLIGSQVLVATQATFDTNTILSGNISNAYNHLKIVLVARDNSAGTSVGAANAQFNGDTAANYDLQYFYGNQATMTAAQSLAGTSCFAGLCVNGGAAAGLFAQAETLIACYAQTTAQKLVTSSGFSRVDATTTGIRTWQMGGNWRNTAAITRIVLTPSSGSFAAGSAFYLYGLL